MIRRENNGGWILITQHDHAELAARIMSHWGNEQFAAPEPYDAVLFAVNEHDSGWKKWDSKPKINPETGFPANFTEMSFEDQGDIWRRCYKPYSSTEPYASCLVALHFSKFARNNLRKESGNEVSHALYKEFKKFVAKELNLTFSNGNLQNIPREVIKNLKLLQIGDILSLTLCHGWRSIEITEAPIDYKGSETILQMTSDDGFNYQLNPYPFDVPEHRFEIKGKQIQQKSFSSDKELRDAIKASETMNLDFTIRKS
ncbi:MAG: DUF3891 family protein [Thermodesulfobacteriota bacterium]